MMNAIEQVIIKRRSRGATDTDINNYLNQLLQVYKSDYMQKWLKLKIESEKKHENRAPRHTTKWYNCAIKQ